MNKVKNKEPWVSIQELWDKIKDINIGVTGVTGGRSRQKNKRQYE